MTKVALVQMNGTVGDFTGNIARIVNFAQQAYQQGAHLAVTPELSLAGYPPEDLLLRDSFYHASQTALIELANQLAALTDLHVLVGYPLLRNGKRYNAAALLVNGEVRASYCKHDLPNDQVFDEKRYFSAGNDALVFELGNELEKTRFGVVICEDAWYASAPAKAKAAGAEVLLVLNGSPFHMNKHHLRYQMMHDHVTKLGLAVVYVNLVGGQDELVFDGNSFVLDKRGQLKARLKHAQEDMQIIEFAGARPTDGVIEMEPSIEAQVYQALVLGVRDYVVKNGFPGVLLGLSGGVDSALALAVAVDALGADKVRAVMMPSQYTAEISWLDAREMAAKLKVRYNEISITACVDAFTETLAKEFAGLKADTTEENIQARARGVLLMALSNKYGSIVLTTGNKSEMAVGYCTLYGDMAGGFAVLKDITKTLVYRLCHYRNGLENDGPIILDRILTRAPSAELRPNQTDQDSLPPYEVVDGVIELYMEENLPIDRVIAAGFKKSDVDHIVRLIKLNEYKRRQAPVGIRITHRAFGRDWRYPITSQYRD